VSVSWDISCKDRYCTRFDVGNATIVPVAWSSDGFVPEHCPTSFMFLAATAPVRPAYQPLVPDLHIPHSFSFLLQSFCCLVDVPTMAAFAPTPPGTWAPPVHGVAAARAVAPIPRMSLPRRGPSSPVTPMPRAATTTAARKADTFAPPRFYDFVADAVAAVHLRHAQVETEALARVVFGLVESGDKLLAELSASLSSDATSRAAGGDLGWWDPHKGVAADPACGLLDVAAAAALVGAGAAPSPFLRSPPAALLAEATHVRPNTLQLLENFSGWHVFVVEDARYALRPTLKHPPRAADAFRHKAGAKAGVRNGTGAGAGIPPTTPLGYHITTLGCAMNEANSERMAAELESAGYAPVDDVQKAAVVVWNTCSIRDHAEQKVYSALGRHAARR